MLLLWRDLNRRERPVYFNRIYSLWGDVSDDGRHSTQ